MARIRTIKPEFWDEDEVTPFLSPLAALTFVGLISVADDEGRGKAGEAALWKRLHGGRPRTTRKAFQAALKELADSEVVVFYSVDSKDYYELPNFLRHQKIDRPNPSILPQNPSKNEGRRTVVEPSTNGSREVGEQSPPEGKGMDRKGGEEVPVPDSVGQQLVEQLPVAGTAPTRDGTAADFLAKAYQQTHKGLISNAKAHTQIEASLAVGVKAKDIEAAFYDPVNKGRKIWEILDPLRDQVKGAVFAKRRDENGPPNLSRRAGI